MSDELNTGTTLEEAKKLVVMWHKKWAQEKLEKQFIQAYYNPRDTSFRQMVHSFSELSEDQKNKLIDLAMALRNVAESRQ